MKQKVWFITGASRGFGRIWAEAALQRGDKVAATARDKNDLKPLQQQFGDSVLCLPLNVTNRDACFSAIGKANEYFGQLDIVINNAGYGLFGFVEEITEAQGRQQMETNFFGALWVTQAALPIMRAQKSGHILQVSSIGGVVAFPSFALYHASKWALEGLSDSLSQQVAQFGIHVTLVEPGGFDTDWAGSSAVHTEPIDAYDKLRNQVTQSRAGMKRGNPAATAEAIFQVVDAANPPLRIFLGAAPLQMAKEQYRQRIVDWEHWQKVSAAAQ